MVKITYSDDLPQITAPANDGQDLQVPSRPLSPDYTVFLKILVISIAIHLRAN